MCFSFFITIFEDVKNRKWFSEICDCGNLTETVDQTLQSGLRESWIRSKAYILVN